MASDSKKVCVTSRSWVSAMVATGTLYQINLNPTQTQFGSRANTMGTIFQEFRFKKVRLMFNTLGTASVADTNLVCGYYPLDQGTDPPAAFEEVAEGANTAVFFAGSTLPKRMALSQKDFSRYKQYNWYRCQTDSYTNSAELYQGVLWFFHDNASTRTLKILLEAEMEFRGPQSSTTSVARSVPSAARSRVAASDEVLSWADEAEADEKDQTTSPAEIPSRGPLASNGHRKRSGKGPA